MRAHTVSLVAWRTHWVHVVTSAQFGKLRRDIALIKWQTHPKGRGSSCNPRNAGQVRNGSCVYDPLAVI